MTKNQINYLLALATLVVVWLYFNTFFGGAMAQKKMTSFGRTPVPMMEGGQAPYFPRTRTPRTGMPSLEEIKKMAEAKKLPMQTDVAAATSVKAPVVAVPEKKQ